MTSSFYDNYQSLLKNLHKKKCPLLKINPHKKYRFYDNYQSLLKNLHEKSVRFRCPLLASGVRYSPEAARLERSEQNYFNYLLFSAAKGREKECKIPLKGTVVHIVGNIVKREQCKCPVKGTYAHIGLVGLRKIIPSRGITFRNLQNNSRNGNHFPKFLRK